MGGLGAAGAQMGKGIGQVAGGLVRIGTVAAVAAITATGAAAKIATSFEDAFAAVRKTVEGTTPQLDAIDKALRTLSTTIPVTFQGLSTIASEAGALGVATKDIVNFTEAVARTSAATVGLDPFAASEAFGKLSTIFGLHGDTIDATTGRVVSDYERLGSALVALGNAGASSEADIIMVTKRFAAAGQIAGLSAAEVLGWSSALASLGPEAEAAGGALQRLFNRAARNIGLMGEPGAIGKNARKRVETFAAVTGMTVDEFAKLYASDASLAMQKFIQGLQGMDQFQSARALFEAGVINQRDILAIQAFSTRYEVLNKQLGISIDAWTQNTALQTISEKRFDTLKNKAIEFKNQVLVGAAAVGDGMLPALTRLVGKAKEFVALHMGDLEQLGRDIGAGLDRIDWSEIRRGVQSFVDLLKDALDIIKQIPVKVDLMVLGFLGLNKVSGGMLSAGLGNIIGGLGKGVANVLLAGLSKIPVVGGVVGAVTATRVFVVNFPPGFGVGPGGPVKPPGTPPVPWLGPAVFAASLPFVLAGDTPMSANDKEKADELARRIAEYSKRDPNAFFSADTSVDRRTNAQVLASLREELAAIMDVRAAVNAAINDPSMTDALDRSASYLQQSLVSLSDISASSALAAQRLGIMAGIRITGPVPSVPALHAIGSTGDPFGFKHLKAFSLGQIPAKDMEKELARHLVDIQGAIRRASDKGDTKTVQKLSETRAGLMYLLGLVKDGTFTAGEKAYDGALLAAAAADRTTAAVNAAAVGIAGALSRAGYGIPYGPGGSPYPNHPAAPNYLNTPKANAPSAYVPNYSNTPKGGVYARGTVGLARMPHQAMFGEAENEGVAIIRNPREWMGGRGTQIDVYPQPVTIMLDGREVARSAVKWADGRRVV